MPGTVRLKDGSAVVIRPMRADDLERSVAFFSELPEEDRDYLRVDVTRRANVERRIRAMETGLVKRLVAVAGDAIVADGALETQEPGWKQHVAEIRLIVAGPFRRKGLGLLMARELYRLAAQVEVKELIARMMRPQKAARRIFRQLGFRDEIVLPDYVVDRLGRPQDMLLMRCDLEGLWKEMEDLLLTSDWQRTR